MASELTKRLTLGPVLALLVGGALVIDLTTRQHWGLLSVMVLSVLVAARETTRLARSVAPRVQTLPVLVVSLVVVADAFVRGGGATPVGLPPSDGWNATPVVALAVALGLAWAGLTQMRRVGTQDFFDNVSTTVLAMVYVGVTCHLMISLGLRSDPPGHGAAAAALSAFPGRGTALLIVMVAAIKLCDSGAFFGGRALGRNKLAPSISPGKTWEGFAAGVVAGTLGAWLAAWLLGLCLGRDLFAVWWHALVWGAVLAPVGVVGDLMESAMKRQSGVKDSGRALPGFGGFLDVFDAIIPSVPVAYVLLLILG